MSSRIPHFLPKVYKGRRLTILITAFSRVGFEEVKEDKAKAFRKRWNKIHVSTHPARGPQSPRRRRLLPSCLLLHPRPVLPVTLHSCQCLLLHRRNRNRQVAHLQLPPHLQHLHLSKPTPLSMLFLSFILWISSLLTSSENTASITPSLGRHPQRACPQAMPTISSLHGQAAPKHGHSIPIPCPSPLILSSHRGTYSHSSILKLTPCWHLAWLQTSLAPKTLLSPGSPPVS